MKLTLIGPLSVGFAVFILLAPGFTAQADPPPGWKAKELSPAAEKKWIEAVKQRKTADGATVWQVLQFAEKMRPNKFKVGSIDVGYNGESGDPEAVDIGYWIGLKRLDDNSYVDLGYEIKMDGEIISVIPPKNEYTTDTATNAMEMGRESFITYLDRMYKLTCIDAETYEKLC